MDDTGERIKPLPVTTDKQTTMQTFQNGQPTHFIRTGPLAHKPFSIPPDTWRLIFKQIHGSSRNTTTQEGNYKRLTRWHYTPSKLKSLFPTTSSHCWRCHDPEGHTTHIWWTCPVISNYWKRLHSLIQTTLYIYIPFTPISFLFLTCPQTTNKLKAVLLTHLLSAANQLIPTL
ncbi:Hypothetical predicted protein [Pelobates cultripes]|uniref:Uncharacterized protein n=1 Tax=Pelobates cultripes TaxID=61616 RepID=A0AAD1SGU2_PELCU|nr:Hypothetical predicted protein [Pelobates cultripes]